MYYRKVLAMALAMVVGSLTPVPGVAADDVDRVIAVVNDDIITKSELEDRLRGVISDLRSARTQLPPMDILRRQMLERMIRDRIQLQVAKRAGIEISQEAIDEAIEGIAQNNNMTVRQLRAALDTDGIPYYTLRDNIMTQLTIRQLIDQRIRSRVVVTDEEIDVFLAGQDQNADIDAYEISHILVRVPEGASSAQQGELETKARAALDSLNAGNDFAEVAVEYSDSQDALTGGYLGWRKPGQVPALFANALNRMQAGQHTDVLRSANGFHILKLLRVRGSDVVEVAQTKARHILIKVDDFISEQEATERLLRLRERIENGEDLGELAKVHSDDLVSAANNGELGWISPGDLVRPFEIAMAGLQPGQLSQPVKTRFGMHLIEVLDRRVENMAEALDRGKARAQIMARKTDERYNDWVQRMRDESYVEIIQ